MFVLRGNLNYFFCNFKATIIFCCLRAFLLQISLFAITLFLDFKMSKSPDSRQLESERFFGQNVSAPSQNPATDNKSSQKVPDLANVVNTTQ
jgi:hypothetical protein